MQEIELFESWINSITESTVLPTSTQQQQELEQALSEPLTVGADATNATETLSRLFMDPELQSDLHALSQTDPNADARPIVMSRMSAYRSQPGIATLMAKISNATAQDEQPAAPGPDDEAVDTSAAPAPDATQPPEPPVSEDYDDSLAAILAHAGVRDHTGPAPNYVVGSR